MTLAALCPHCGKPRMKYADSGTRAKTCGERACHSKAIAASLTARSQPDRQVLHLPRRTGEIDFKNGFASQNLSFAPDLSRLRP